MANKPLKSIKFPGLSDTYTVPQIDNTLATAGKAADAKAAGDVVKVSSTQPTEATNKLWVKDQPGNEYTVPLYSEFEELKSALDEYSYGRLTLTQFSETRLATPILSRPEAESILKNFYLAEPDKYYVTLYGSNVQDYAIHAELYGWGATLDDIRTALNNSTYKYHWLYFKNAADGSATITPDEVVYQRVDFTEYQNLSETVASDAKYNQQIWLESYSATRLCTPVYTVATDKERISQLWLSNDTDYECVLMGNYINQAMDSNGFVILAWGMTYEAFRNALLSTDAVYFYMFFRNKSTPNGNILPSELRLIPYMATQLQRKVEALDNSIYNGLSGKTFAVFGDSIGTHGNSGKWCNVPELTVTADDVGQELSAYVTYYDVYSNINHSTGEGTLTGMTIGGLTLGADDIGTEVTFTPTADDVGKSLGKVFDWNGNDLPVWWVQLAEKYDMTPIPVCWASASYSTHEDDVPRLTAAYAWHPSQIRKAGIRTPGTMTRTAPDYVILARGVNDLTHAPYDVLSANTFDDVNWRFPTGDKVGDNYGMKEAIVKTIEAIWNAYPTTKIILCTLPYIKRVDYNNFPTTNTLSNYPQWNDAIRECADYFGCGLIDFSKDGVTHANLSTYAPDGTHPNAAGHMMMAKRAIVDFPKM